MLDMIERLLLEADLEDQLPKLEAIITNINIVNNIEDQLPNCVIVINIIHPS